MKIIWDDGTVHEYEATHDAFTILADYLNYWGWFYSPEVKKVAGDVQCGAGDLQCATGKPDGYYKEELGWPNREFVWIPFYDNKPED